MVYLETSQEWLEQSSLLLAARPSTTKILTKYRVQKPNPRPARRRPATGDAAAKTEPTAPEPDAAPQPSAFLTVKTWDPATGVCLKYRTNKAAEVGRLFGSLGRLGRGMVGLPDREEAAEGGGGDTAMLDVPGGGDEASRAQSPAPGAKAGGTGAGGATGGGKKKKKGKK